MLTIMARILAAKPHSADVERCISANNLLKTSLRASLDISTENTEAQTCEVDSVEQTQCRPKCKKNSDCLAQNTDSESELSQVENKSELAAIQATNERHF